jgi:hypothetical protein
MVLNEDAGIPENQVVRYSVEKINDMNDEMSANAFCKSILERSKSPDFKSRHSVAVTRLRRSKSLIDFRQKSMIPVPSKRMKPTVDVNALATMPLQQAKTGTRNILKEISANVPAPTKTSTLRAERARLMQPQRKIVASLALNTSGLNTSRRTRQRASKKDKGETLTKRPWRN